MLNTIYHSNLQCTFIFAYTFSHSLINSIYPKCNASGLYNSVTGLGKLLFASFGMKLSQYGGTTLRIPGFCFALLTALKKTSISSSVVGVTRVDLFTEVWLFCVSTVCLVGLLKLMSLMSAAQVIAFETQLP